MPKTLEYFYVFQESTLPILFKKKCGSSELYQEIQTSGIINSCYNNESPIGSYTGNKITNVNINGDINCVYTTLHNVTSKNNICKNSPPNGVIGFSFSLLNQTTIPTKANENPSYIFPPNNILVLKGLIVSNLCSGAYLGAVGTSEHIIDLNKTPLYNKTVVKYVIPSQFKFTNQIIDNAQLAIRNNNTNKNKTTM
jgi:hypothetical protein